MTGNHQKVYVVIRDYSIPNLDDSYYDDHYTDIYGIYLEKDVAMMKANALNNRTYHEHEKDKSLRSVNYSVVERTLR